MQNVKCKMKNESVLTSLTFASCPLHSAFCILASPPRPLTPSPPHPLTLSSRRRGISLLEVALSSLLVGVVLAAAMRTVGGSVFTQYRVAERITARFLAEGLLTEILAKDYKEAGSTTIGPDAGESSTSKANYDDVDDFHNWSESPPQLADGTPMPDLSGWRRSVEVAYVDPTDLSQTSLSDTGVKRITVTVTHNEAVVATRMAIRTDAP